MWSGPQPVQVFSIGKDREEYNIENCLKKDRVITESGVKTS
jgi:hypothetical protein